MAVPYHVLAEIACRSGVNPFSVSDVREFFKRPMRPEDRRVIEEEILRRDGEARNELDDLVTEPEIAVVVPEVCADLNLPRG